MVDKKNRKQYVQEQLALGTACYRKGEIDKSIGYLSKIQREDDKEQYAKAQFNLGVIYQEQDELTKAVEHWSKIQREDDKEQYAQAQFNLGVVYKQQGELAKAVEHFITIQREDDKEQYAKAQFNLGVIYQKQDELTKAVEHWSSIQREDSKKWYIQSQFDLGMFYYKKGEPAKAIDHFITIQREDDKELYTQAQLCIGVFYQQQVEPAKAIGHWSNIKKDDDKRQYALAQLGLGAIYQQQDEPAKVIGYWSAIQREDDKKAYSYAQFDLGGFYYDQNDLAKAIEHWSAIQREDDKEQYTRAQFNLGMVYKQQGELARAIEHFITIQREDDKELYAKVQLNLGGFYYDQNDLAKAIEHWSAIQREDDKERHAKAQLNLGVIYHEQDELTKAVEYWSNIQREDDKEQYAQAQFNLGVVYFNQDELGEAKKYIGEALAQQENNFLKASILLDKITILQAYTKGKKSKDYTDFKQGLDDIDDDVNKVLESLMIKFEEGKPERKVATYTTLRVAKLFIENKEESFHLNIANRMNDTTEGQNLFKWMGYAENTETTNTIYGFLTSFTFNHNSLNQFRLYGKTEDKEGTGVSFVVSTEIFGNEHSDNYIKLNMDAPMAGIKSDAKLGGNQHKDKNEGKNNKLITEKIPLYRCIYINPENGYVSLARRSRYSFFLEHGDLDGKTRPSARNRKLYNKYRRDMDQLEKLVRETLQKIKTNYGKVIALADKKQLRQQTDQLIRKILLPLCFLTKHAAFEEEAECRIIYITDIANEKVTFEKGRLFVGYGVPVLDRQTNKSYLNKIYLGPKVEDVVKIELQHLYYQQGIKEPIRIEKSNLPLA